MQTVTLLKNDFKKEESRNIDREITLEKRIKQLDNIVFKRDQSAQTVHMLTKPQFFYDHTTKQALGFKNPFYLKKAQQLEPMLYDGNVIQKTNAIVILDSEETLMLAEESHSKMLLKQKDPIILEKKVNTTPVDYANSVNSAETTISSRPTKVEVPKELPKFSMVNTSLKKLKHHLARFDVVVKERTTTIVISKDIVNMIVNSSVDNASVNVHSLKLKTELFNKKDFVEKEIYDKLFKSFTTLEKHRISLEVDTQLNQEIFQSLQEKVLVITALKDDLRKLKGKALVDNDVTKHPSDPEMLKIDMEPITPKLLNKRTAHSAYIKHTQEEAAVLRDLVDHVKANYPLDHTLDSACRYTKLIQELLTNIGKTCPSINNSGEKLVAVTPKNKDKRVRFTEPVTSSGNTITKIASTSNLVSNKPMLSSTGVKPSISASGSQPSGNTKKDKIQQTPSSTQKNKVEAHTRKCNGCMLFDNHDLCVLDFINNVNACTKSKSVKKSSKKKVWKPTGKGFINIGYIWRPTGRTFTIVGNTCPLTRITTTTEVPLRKPTALDNETSKPVVTLVYSRKPRKSKTNVPVSKSKVLKSISANIKEPSQSWGSIVSDVPSSSLDECRSSKLFSARINPTDLNLKTLIKEKLYLLHMDLCGLMRVVSVNGKKYILVIVNDYSRFTWVNCLRLKEEAPHFIIKFLKMIQVRFKVPVRCIRTDNGTGFFNQTLREYYEKVGISHETSVAHSLQKNGVVERRNRTLIEVARTMLIYAKALLFLWAEAVATTCYTENHSIIRLRYGNTPYELLHDKPPDLSFFHVFGTLCYPTNDSENLAISGHALHEMILQPISSQIGPKPSSFNTICTIYPRTPEQFDPIHEFDEKRGTIFNSNKEVVMIAPRVRDVYFLDMTSSAQESCFFAKAFENLNWL
ncbi:retrovirus-related pol polyprotein from transposon TNT 1-94 [Tanacetum coccineum]